MLVIHYIVAEETHSCFINCILRYSWNTTLGLTVGYLTNGSVSRLTNLPSNKQSMYTIYKKTYLLREGLFFHLDKEFAFCMLHNYHKPTCTCKVLRPWALFARLRYMHRDLQIMLLHCWFIVRYCKVTSKTYLLHRAHIKAEIQSHSTSSYK